MKTMILVMAGFLLLSFSGKQETVEGLWMGAFKYDIQRENIVVKFVAPGEVELYQGEVEENNKIRGTYTLEGDSALHIIYKAQDGKQVSMHGSMNKRRNFMEGNWENDNHKGEFFLRKQRIQEMYAQP